MENEKQKPLLESIASFGCSETEDVFYFAKSRRFKAVEKVAHRKLEMINAATDVTDLKSPPGNHLEALKGDRKGQYSIRINRQWRICFIWKNGKAHNVKIEDYH
tara:strand:+ start:172 stop:483 length:312 start_codon:yes stop_codon:yes gene_type:complete